uniref:Uncharacterized protein n=1 Tax=Arundo donax TaxID=35708 RepID=A0A0A9HNC0_ARUDO
MQGNIYGVKLLLPTIFISLSLFYTDLVRRKYVVIEACEILNTAVTVFLFFS